MMKSYTITVNGIAYDVTVEERTGNYVPTSTTTYKAPVTQVAPTPVAVPTTSTAAPQSVEETKSPANTPAASGSEGSIKVNSPMPGKILAIKVNIGQAVKRGDVILILEAMKMENEIVAAEDGTIASIHVNVGEMVESGVVLATLN